MLILGTSNILNCIDETYTVYNLTSYLEGIPSLLDLLPTIDIIKNIDDNNMEQVYHNVIMNNDNAFMMMMSIVLPLYEGNNVLLLIGENPELDILHECLTRYLQTRYGIIGNVIYDESDFDSCIDKQFTNMRHFIALDEDKKRWSYLYTSQNMSKTSNGEVHINGY